MNKYEWFRRLNENLGNISADERERVKEYYEELYQDKQERGESEEQILSSFGEPSVAAKRIVGDFAFDASGKSDIGVETGKGAPSGKAGKNPKEDKFDALVALGCILGFFVAGAVFSRWRTAWLAFFLIPIIITFRLAIKKRSASYFAYPVLVTLIYLAFGMYFGIWHPTWILFITIPVYYVFCPQRKEDEAGADKSDDSVEKKEGKRKAKRKISKAVKIIILVSVVLIVGVTIAAFTMTTRFTGYAFDKIDRVETIDATAEQISEINVITDVNAVFVEPAAVEKITVSYIENEKLNYDLSFKDGAVKIEIKQKTPMVFDYVFDYDFPKDNRFILIKVPLYVDKTAILNIKNDTGAVDLSGGSDAAQCYKEVDINAGTGSVSVKNVSADNIGIDNSTGSVKLKNVTAAALDISGSTGSIAIENSKIDSVKLKNSTGSIGVSDMRAEELSADVGTGSVSVTSSAVKKLAAKTSTGSVNVECESEEIDLSSSTGSIRLSVKANKIKAKTSTASVKGVVKGVETEYNIKAECKAGSSNLTNRLVTGSDKWLDISVGSGSIKITFEE